MIVSSADSWISWKKTIEYHVLGNGEPPQNYWRSHPGLTFPLAPGTFCVDPWVHPGGLIASDGKGGAVQLEGTEVIFLWCRQDLSSQQMFQTAHNSNPHTGNPKKMNSSITQTGFLQSNDEQFIMVTITIFQDRKSSNDFWAVAKKDQTARRCSLGHWHIPLPDSCFFQKIAAQVEAQNIISQRMSLDRMLHENAWTNPPILPNHLLRSASPVPKDLRI